MNTLELLAQYDIKSARIIEEALPTDQRAAKSDLECIGTGRGETLGTRVAEPLLIDKLHKNGTLNDMQHMAGIQIITLHTIASHRHAYRENSMYPSAPEYGLEDTVEAYSDLPSLEATNLYHKTLSLMTRDTRKTVSKVCFEGIEPIALIGVAFDLLGDALANARDILQKEVDSAGR